MKTKDQDTLGRRSLLTNMGIAAAATGLVVSSTSAAAQAPVQPAGFKPVQHSQDSWLGELQGGHRVFIDSSNTAGGANALRYANNIITAHEEDYDGKAADYAMVICFRHASTPYAFDDAIWAKYGAGFSRSADPTPSSNPMNVPTGSNGQNSISSVVAKGVQFAICSRATRSLSRRLATSMGIPSERILEELLAGAIPNSRFVPAGVVAVTRAQEYGYSLLYSA
jgi:intracellular sulfur oxidation DsrE/DsrF family protein